MVGEFVPTPKNAQVEDFYPRHGFVEVVGARNGTGRTFVFDLGQAIPPAPAWFVRIVGETA
jgi:predicted enzyme involved in methoxymalonyl-ACP biosynthesis